MEDFVRTRMKEVMSRKDISSYALSGGNAALQRKINNQVNKETTISVDVVLLLLSKFPDVSAEWLLRGTGNMYLHGDDRNVANVGTMSGGNVQVGSGSVVNADASKDELIAELVNQNKKLIEYITRK